MVAVPLRVGLLHSAILCNGLCVDTPCHCPQIKSNPYGHDVFQMAGAMGAFPARDPFALRV